MSRILSFQGRRDLCLKELLAILLIAVSLFIYYKDTLKSVGKELVMLSPSSAKLIGIRRNIAPSQVLMKVGVPAADWPEFIARNHIDPNPKDVDQSSGFLSLDDGFWDPKPMTRPCT